MGGEVRIRLLVIALFCLLPQCATIQPPTGGEEDKAPPHLVSTMPETLAALAGVSNIVAVKEASGSLDQASAIRARVPFTLLCGDDSLTLPMIAVGAAGVISVAGNVAPRPMRDLCDLARGGRMAEAEALHRKLLPLFKALFVESNPGPAKYLLAAMGLIENELRLPLVPVEPVSERIVREAAIETGLPLAPVAAGRA